MQKLSICLIMIAAGLLLGCSTPDIQKLYNLNGYGAPRCANPASSTAIAQDCKIQNERYSKEYKKIQSPELLSSKDALKDDDSLCYQNPRAGEKPCAK